MKLQPDTISKKISHIVPDLQTSFSNYNMNELTIQATDTISGHGSAKDLLLKDWMEIFL